MKKLIIFFIVFTTAKHSNAQIKWSEKKNPSDIEWNNYSTTFLGNIKDRQPLLVAAIPYNGTFSNTDGNSAFDMDFTGSLFRYRSPLSKSGQQLYTHDSGSVYFLTPGIFKQNASEYEYRIVLNGKTEIVPWTIISEFSDLQLNDFKKGFGFLGGYKTTWGNSISAELRKKNTDSPFALTTVYWKETKPVISSVFTEKNMNDFFALLQRPWSSKGAKGYSPKRLILSPEENTAIFYLSAEVFKKEAIEYRLKKDGHIQRDWGTNDYDNNFIWLKNLSPGKYELEIRYSRQRHSIAVYNFEKKPQWQQTTWFKFLTGSLLAAFLGFIVLLFRNKLQKRKLEQSELEKEKLQLRINSIRSQLNPHFVFNALSSIQWLVNKKDADAANEYLSAFSSLLRHSLQYNEVEWIAIQQEAQMIDTYLSLEKLRFPINYDISLTDNVAPVEIPSFFIQTLIENSVKHGHENLQQGLEIKIAFYSVDKNLYISIEDKGKGFDPLKTQDGYGLKLTKQRIELLNNAMKDRKIELSIQSKINAGTKILLTFSNWLA
ncbi:MAG: histidine kinase [Ferruginibacter sp.]|nr:histidine kinase [Ferruginibacter sp.]